MSITFLWVILNLQQQLKLQSLLNEAVVQWDVTCLLHSMIAILALPFEVIKWSPGSLSRQSERAACQRDLVLCGAESLWQAALLLCSLCCCICPEIQTGVWHGVFVARRFAASSQRQEESLWLLGLTVNASCCKHFVPKSYLDFRTDHF